MEDILNNPFDKQVGGSHYKGKGMQPIELIETVRMFGSCSSILRYVYRHKDKNGKQDLEKALHYVEFIKNYGNWYESGIRYPSNRDNIFYRFIQSNTQLSANQIKAVLAIENTDIEGLESAILSEMEENYK